MGMNPTTFGSTLSGKEKFVVPEAVLVYTDKGLNTMSTDFFINCIEINFVRGLYKEKARPIFGIIVGKLVIWQIQGSKIIAWI